jgi:hypothetical protein
MKFLKLQCESRRASVYVNIDKIVLIRIAFEGNKEICFIEVEGLNDGRGAIEVHSSAEEIVRQINGENKTQIGFRSGF